MVDKQLEVSSHHVDLSFSFDSLLQPLSVKQETLFTALVHFHQIKLSDASLRFIVEDDQSTIEGATAAYNKLIHEDGVPVILGVYTSTMVRAVFPIAQENEVVAISPTSAARGLSAIGDFVFRVALTVDALIPGSVKLTREKLGYERVVTMYQSMDVFSQSSDEVLRQAFSENGVEVLTTETFETGAMDRCCAGPIRRRVLRDGSHFGKGDCRCPVP